MALFLVQFGSEAAKVLCLFRLCMAFSCLSLADSLVMVETFAMQFLESFHVLILRHGDGGDVACTADLFCLQESKLDVKKSAGSKLSLPGLRTKEKVWPRLHAEFTRPKFGKVKVT